MFFTVLDLAILSNFRHLIHLAAGISIPKIPHSKR